MVREYSIVRVIKLNKSDRNFDGTGGVKRPPQIGDTGTVVHMADGGCIVECTDRDGMTVWLADFLNEEIEEIDERIERIKDDLASAAADVRAVFGSLSPEQLNWKPAAESWSVAQCLDHLILTNKSMEPAIEAKLSGKANSLWEKASPLSGFFGRFLKNHLMEDKRKFKAPSRSIVPPSEIDGDIVERFCEHQRHVARQVEDIGKLDLDRTVVTSPYLRVMTYRLGDALDIMIEHEKRHIRQAKRVLETAGFAHGEE